MSITEPDLSSLAAPKPPNPVLAVMSGSRELEPLMESLEGDFFSRLFVTSGMDDMKFLLLFTTLGTSFTTELLDITVGGQKVKLELASLTSVFDTAWGVEKVNLDREGVILAV